MAKRHVIDYFNKVADQYHSMLVEIKDFEEECNKGLIEPERLDEIKRIIISLQLHDEIGTATPANWTPGDDALLGAPLTLEEAEDRKNRDDVEIIEWYLAKKKL